MGLADNMAEAHLVMASSSVSERSGTMNDAIINLISRYEQNGDFTHIGLSAERLGKFLNTSIPIAMEVSAVSRF